MNDNKISANELKIIESLSRNSHSSQRDISRDIGMSLGLTNILINRMAKKGYLKISHLNAKRVRYILTPSALKEKAKKSYNFMRRSFSVMNSLKVLIADFTRKKYEDGYRDFIIVGRGELSEITEFVLQAMHFGDMKISHMESCEHAYDDKVMLNTVQGESRQQENCLDIWGEAEKLYGSVYELQ